MSTFLAIPIKFANRCARRFADSRVEAVADASGNIPLSPGVNNLFELLKACGNTTAYDSLLADYAAGKLQYGALKGEVAEALVALTTPFKNIFSPHYRPTSDRVGTDPRVFCGYPQSSAKDAVRSQGTDGAGENGLMVDGRYFFDCR